MPFNPKWPRSRPAAGRLEVEQRVSHRVGETTAGRHLSSGPSLVINEGSCVETRAQRDYLDPERCSLTITAPRKIFQY